MKCDYCRKNVGLREINTLLSGSTSGVKMITYLCRRCVKNKMIINEVMMRNENKLSDLDKLKEENT